jgi:hypothetical protein
MESSSPGGPRPRNRLPVSSRGGYRPGAGRKPGTMNKLAKEARDLAAQTGALPHELLLQWGRGEPMARKVLKDGGDPKNPAHWVTTYEGVDAEIQKDSAKAAAPYYAPKISTVEVIQGVSDADLDEFIARAAAEAGVSVGAGREGQEDEE